MGLGRHVACMLGEKLVRQGSRRELRDPIDKIGEFLVPKSRGSGCLLPALGIKLKDNRLCVKATALTVTRMAMVLSQHCKKRKRKPLFEPDRRHRGMVKTEGMQLLRVIKLQYLSVLAGPEQGYNYFRHRQT